MVETQKEPISIWVSQKFCYIRATCHNLLAIDALTKS